MLSAHQITKIYGIQPVLEDISFNITTGDRVGLVGPNGCGKTTLMRILAGVDQPDSGTVALTRPGLRIGYLAQGFDLDPGLTLSDALAPDPPAELDAEMARLAAALAGDPQDASLQDRYDILVSRLADLPGEAERAQVLNSLGLIQIGSDTPVGSLSGGQKTRLMLARLLLDNPHLLLLDEPTNHLDIQMLEWLEAWLRRFQGAALIVSHDRAFLDNTVTRILEMDPPRPGLHDYSGNYSAYFEQRQAEIEGQRAAFQDQQAEIRRLKADIARTKQQAYRVEQTTTSREPGVRRYAKKVAKKALSREKKLDRFLESDEIVARPRASWQLKLDFQEPAHKSRDVLVSRDLAIGYPGHPPLLTGLRLHLRSGMRVALTGPNGCGKTTLLRTIAGVLEPASGSMRLGASAKLGYMTQEQENLDLERTPLEIIQAAGVFNQTEARAFLHHFLFSGDDPLRPAGKLSFGERSRLELALLVAQGCTFLLLDEPVNHLDIPSRTRFEQTLSNFEGTVLAVVHDRYFIERFATAVWTVEDGRIRT
ncbi:MAG: ribosomal protection-like ABC-F family protein [Chloroflexota bacterium]